MKAFSNLLADAKESLRVKKLTNLELVKEAFRSEWSDEPVAREMMDRLSPDWINDPSFQE